MEGIFECRKPTIGEIEISRLSVENSSADQQRAGIQEKFLYTFHPAYRIACRLPERCSLQFECTVDHANIRRFAPLPSLDAFLPWVGLVGHIVLDDVGKAKLMAGLTLDELRLLGQYVRHLREFVGPTPKLENSLNIRRSARTTHGEEDRDILPAEIGLNANGRSQRWTLNRFSTEGRQAATEAGISTPTARDVFVRGLMRSAERAPLKVRGRKQAQALIRSALFALPPSPERLTSRHLEYVSQQAKASLRKHLKDTPEQFNAWLEDRKSNLIRVLI